MRACQIAQTGSNVDGITVAVAVDNLDLARRHTDTDGQMLSQGLLQQIDLVLTLHVNHGMHGRSGITEDDQHPVTQRLDHLPALRLQKVANPEGQLGDRPGGPGIAEGLENGGTAGQISENDGGIDTHAGTGLIASVCSLGHRPRLGYRMAHGTNAVHEYFRTCGTSHSPCTGAGPAGSQVVGWMHIQIAVLLDVSWVND